MKETKFMLKNGQEVTIRNAAVSDAKSMIEFMKIIYSETDFLTGYPDEVNLTIEQEEAWINNYDHQLTTMIVAKAGDEVVGNVSINALGNKDKVKHRCGLGITIAKAYWRQGLGRKLMNEAIAFASQAGYEQIELEVIAKNHRAIPLYLSSGFEVYGTRPRAFKLRDGSYLNEYLMVHKIR